MQRQHFEFYTTGVGETSCRTYERLRQLCNSDFRVRTLNPKSPPDVCNEQYANCCCNSVAFSLSMLCLTCQQGIGPFNSGFDAKEGTYQAYLASCTPQLNKILPTDIQSGVCNNKIKIYDHLYENLWDNGGWYLQVIIFFHYTAQHLTVDQHAGPNFTTYCPVGGNTSSTSNPINYPEPTNIGNSEGSLGKGDIAAIVIGTMVIVAGLVGAVCYFLRRRKRTTGLQQPDTREPDVTEARPYPLYSTSRATPFRKGQQSETTNAMLQAENGTSPSATRNSEMEVSPLTTGSRHTDGDPVALNPLRRTLSGRSPPTYSDLGAGRS
ncbi:hypothetical protein PM082_009422 [Marasmius tenuissimus]|nr:hypothetical protein PM082_009422 [Marasmius tenuissimus]